MRGFFYIFTFVFHPHFLPMEILTNPEVITKFESYAPPIREKLWMLRQLIIDTAAQNPGITRLHETLKWGEPSYLTKGGSTVRINSLKKSPGKYAMFFVCSTSLVENFRLIYGDSFTFEGKRALIFDLKDEVPGKELQHCINLALTYHKVKHLPMLGA